MKPQAIIEYSMRFFLFLTANKADIDLLTADHNVYRLIVLHDLDIQQIHSVLSTTIAPTFLI